MTWNPKVNWHLGNQWKTNCELFWFARVCVLFPQWWTSYPSMILGWLNYQLRRCFKLHQNSVRNPWDNLTCHIPSWNCVSKEPETLLGYLSRCIDMCIRTPPSDLPKKNSSAIRNSMIVSALFPIPYTGSFRNLWMLRQNWQNTIWMARQTCKNLMWTLRQNCPEASPEPRLEALLLRVCIPVSDQGRRCLGRSPAAPTAAFCRAPWLAPFLQLLCE